MQTTNNQLFKLKMKQQEEKLVKRCFLYIFVAKAVEEFMPNIN